MLKDKTCEVPRRHHICKGHQTALLCQLLLEGGRGLIITIKLGVVLIVTLADHQYDIRHTITATVYLDLLAGSL